MNNNWAGKYIWDGWEPDYYIWQERMFHRWLERVKNLSQEPSNTEDISGQRQETPESQ